MCCCSLTLRDDIFVHSFILNPNHITDPNPNLNPKNEEKQNDTSIKFNIQLYLKVNFVGHGVGL